MREGRSERKCIIEALLHFLKESLSVSTEYSQPRTSIYTMKFWLVRLLILHDGAEVVYHCATLQPYTVFNLLKRQQQQQEVHFNDMFHPGVPTA